MDGLARPSLRSLIRDAAEELQRRHPIGLTAEQTRARRISLAAFMKASWHLVEPSTPLTWNWTLDAMCDHVQSLLDGTLGKQNLLICVPPGSAKSSVVSVAAPAWLWIRDPARRMTFASGNPSVATRDSLRTRTIVESLWYRNTFGIVWALADDSNQKLIFETSARGFRSATTTGSRVTGSRPHALFVDDALDAADSYSKAERDAVLLWWDMAFANRLADPQTGTRCIIAQRLHPEDLIGHVLDMEPQAWETLVIPMEWEDSQRRVTSLGWTDPRTKERELMFPQRFPQSVVDAERIRLGASGFAGQHQQRPVLAGGELFKTGCAQFVCGDLPAFSSIVISLDTAYSVKQGPTIPWRWWVANLTPASYCSTVCVAATPSPNSKPLPSS